MEVWIDRRNVSYAKLWDGHPDNVETQVIASELFHRNCVTKLLGSLHKCRKGGIKRVEIKVI